VLAVCALAASGCASAHKGGPFAGLDQYDAGNAASNILDDETADPSSRLFHEELAVADVSQGERPVTRRPAWVVSLENFDHKRSRTCLYLWGRFVPFQGSNVNYVVDDCPSSGA
jgi:hypothetical protein